MSADKLRVALSDLFLTAGQAVSRRLQAAGIAQTIEGDLTIIEREHQGPGSMRTSTRKDFRNVLSVHSVSLRAGPWLTGAEIASARECASVLAASTATTLPFWAPLGASGWELLEAFDNHQSKQPTYADDPVDWVLRYIVVPALKWHLDMLPSAADANKSAALAFAEEVLKVARDDRIRYQVLVPVSGIDLIASEGEEFTEGDISIRRLSDAEQGQWFIEHNGPSGYSMMDAEPPEVLLTVHTSGPRNAQHLPAGGVAPHLVAALQLHGYYVAGRFAPEYSDPRWVHTFAPHVPVALPGRSREPASRSALTAGEFRKVAETSKLLTKYNIAQPQSPQDLAFHRFILGLTRQNLSDAVLDYTIALESLLLPDDSRGDLGYRFRLHGAYYLTDTIQNRQSTAQQLNDLYKMRSRLVHGGKYPEAAVLQTMRSTARELLRHGLLRAIHEGFPKAEYFNRIILGAEEAVTEIDSGSAAEASQGG